MRFESVGDRWNFRKNPFAAQGRRYFLRNGQANEKNRHRNIDFRYFVRISEGVKEDRTFYLERDFPMRTPQGAFDIPYAGEGGGTQSLGNPKSPEPTKGRLIGEVLLQQ